MASINVHRIVLGFLMEGHIWFNFVRSCTLSLSKFGMSAWLVGANWPNALNMLNVANSINKSDASPAVCLPQ